MHLKTGQKMKSQNFNINTFNHTQCVNTDTFEKLVAVYPNATLEDWKQHGPETVYYPSLNEISSEELAAYRGHLIANPTMVDGIESKPSTLHSGIPHDINRVAIFHKRFTHPTLDLPSIPSRDSFELGIKLIKEELGELEDAWEDYNKGLMTGEELVVEAADALGDLRVVLNGMMCRWGLQHKMSEVFDEIMDSNESKLDENGEPIINGKNGHHNPMLPPGKILKGPNYFKPNLKKVLYGE